jgi:hypothetical protein
MFHVKHPPQFPLFYLTGDFDRVGEEFHPILAVLFRSDSGIPGLMISGERLGKGETSSLG